jgi:hypothetical protein
MRKYLLLLSLSFLALPVFAQSPQENINFNIQYESNGQSFTFPTTYDIDDYVVDGRVGEEAFQNPQSGADGYVELRYLGYDEEGREYVVYISQYNSDGSYWIEMMFPINEAGDLGNVYYEGPSLSELTRAYRPWDMGPEAPFPDSLDFNDWMGDGDAYTILQSRGIAIEQPHITAYVEQAKDLTLGLQFQEGQWVPSN